MLHIISHIIAISIAAVCGVYVEKKQKYWLLVPTIVFGIYGAVGMLAYTGCDSAETEKKMYVKAKSESEILKSNASIAIETAYNYTKDIEEMNSLIDRSREKCNHWFWSGYYHKETAALEKINCDSINVTLITEFK